MATFNLRKMFTSYTHKATDSKTGDVAKLTTSNVPASTAASARRAAVLLADDIKATMTVGKDTEDEGTFRAKDMPGMQYAEALGYTEEEARNIRYPIHISKTEAHDAHVNAKTANDEAERNRIAEHVNGTNGKGNGRAKTAK